MLLEIKIIVVQLYFQLNVQPKAPLAAAHTERVSPCLGGQISEMHMIHGSIKSQDLFSWRQGYHDCILQLLISQSSVAPDTKKLLWYYAYDW